jgi:hypothetical protein
LARTASIEAGWLDYQVPEIGKLAAVYPHSRRVLANEWRFAMVLSFGSLRSPHVVLAAAMCGAKRAQAAG